MTNNLLTVLGHLQAYFGWRLAGGDAPLPTAPEIDWNEVSPFTQFLAKRKPTLPELNYLGLALVPHLQPQFLDALIREHLPNGGDLPELGGVRGTNHRGLLPTGETALYLLAGNAPDQRLAVLKLFSPDHWLAQQRILCLEEVRLGEPRLGGRLILDAEYIDLFTTGQVAGPVLGAAFPAQHLSTDQTWSDLVLPGAVLTQIRDIGHWLQHRTALRDDWGMARVLKPGYRALFHGPSGTGKTLTATLLGKHTGREVYRIDLSLVVSKYIGETEKNLAKVFERAHAKEWILFFDEADALFGKRTETQDAHDRYANQEVAYLLQKVEEHDGLVILATNLKGNIDPAFSRRFQAMIHFPVPTAAERLRLWQKGLPTVAKLAPNLDLAKIASNYELTGAAIMNVIQFCALRALARQQTELWETDLLEGIHLEYQKEGKVV